MIIYSFSLLSGVFSLFLLYFHFSKFYQNFDVSNVELRIALYLMQYVVFVI